ncbi:Uncharacterised protein [Pasteurella multocida]|uniref:hypothetical protein n=1 Tax=Pasteurella multocida TaxID=747 RepID=UPI000E01402A|nr:hypothetical protein [Pasteurella multocida]SUB37594.1 Uncharacterised protein [Pasteurella multocida]
MKLTKAQKEELLAVYLKAKEENTLIPTSKQAIKARANQKRAAFVQTKRSLMRCFTVKWQALNANLLGLYGVTV